MKAFVVACVLAFATAVTAGPAKVAPRGVSKMAKRSSIPIPASNGTKILSEPMEISGTFDGHLMTYDRGVKCTGQVEGTAKDVVFLLKDGATLKNVVIGANQIEGVHCMGSCTVENVWWLAVCEDALSLKTDGDVRVIGGGARGAADKVIQHNGAGTVTIEGFQVDDFGKLYRSCGNCKQSAERHVIIKGVKASNGKLLAGINPNFGDTATIDSSTCINNVEEVCEEFKGLPPGSEPKSVSTGPSKSCKYTNNLKCC